MNKMAAPKVVVIGSGIAGLSTALSIAQNCPRFHITVLESHEDLMEAGAGIQITPNAASVLCRWGLRQEIEEIATVPACTELRRYADGKIIGKIQGNDHDYSEKVYGYPLWFVHRADYQQVLARAARKCGVTIEFNRRVTGVNCDAVEVVLDDGDVVSADLIVGADGIGSKTRPSIPENSHVKVTPVEETCFRFLVPREKMLSNALTAPLIEDDRLLAIYIGPKKGVVAYPISKGCLYNVVLPMARSTDAPLAAYNQPGDVAVMREQYDEFDETIGQLLQQTDACAQWALCDLPPVPTWCSHNGRVVLVGDAAHAMLPWAASGGSTSIEDAAVLGELFAPCSTPDTFAQATRAYERLRRHRCERIQAISRESRASMTLPDGPAQETRDRFLTDAMVTQEEMFSRGIFAKPKANIGAPFSSPELMMWLYAYDAIKEARDYLTRSGKNSKIEGLL